MMKQLLSPLVVYYVTNNTVNNSTHTKTDCVSFVQTLKQVRIGKVETFDVGQYSLVLFCRFLGLALRRHGFTFTGLGRLCSISRVFWFRRLFTKQYNTTIVLVTTHRMQCHFSFPETRDIEYLCS